MNDKNEPISFEIHEVLQTCTPTSVENVIVEPQVELYPNPMPQNKLVVKIENKAEKIVIYNASGKLVNVFVDPGPSIDFNAPAGIYFLKILTGNGIILTRKIVRLSGIF